MSKRIVVGENDRFGQWVCDNAGGTWIPGRGQVIGLEDTETREILAGFVYEDYNRVNILLHIAAVPGKRWMNREYLWFCFHYPFEQLGCRRMTAVIASSNKPCEEFAKHIGFTLEATLKNAHPDGDLLLYVLYKEDCRWLNLRQKGVR